MSFIVNYHFIQNLKLLERDEFNYLTLILTRTLVMRRGKNNGKEIQRENMTGREEIKENKNKRIQKGNDQVCNPR